jgi:cytochrome P450
VLSNKFGHFEKPQFKVLTKLLANGLTTHEGEKWVKHRRILNPAFHLEKLKVSGHTILDNFHFNFFWMPTCAVSTGIFFFEA